MARNIDKIKELEDELGRWKKKAAVQASEIKALKAEVVQAHASLAEWSLMVDSTLAQVAVAHGAQVGEGAWEIVLPPAGLMQDYIVKTTRGKDTYIVRVERRKPVTPVGGDASEL